MVVFPNITFGKRSYKEKSVCLFWKPLYNVYREDIAKSTSLCYSHVFCINSGPTTNLIDKITLNGKQKEGKRGRKKRKEKGTDKLD